MHFSQSRGLARLIHSTSRQLLNAYRNDQKVATFGTSPKQGDNLIRKEDEKKYLYQIPPWLQKKTSQKPIIKESISQNEAILKENNKCKAVYKMKRRLSPVPKPKHSDETKVENPDKSKKTKSVTHFSPSSIALDSPLRMLNSKNVKYLVQDVDPLPPAADPHPIKSPLSSVAKKPNMKRKLPKPLAESIGKDKMSSNKIDRPESKKLEKFKARLEETEPRRMLEAVGKKDIKKKVVIPKSFEHISSNSVEGKKKIWKEIINNADFQDASGRIKNESRSQQLFSRNKLVVEFPNKPIKFSSKEMLYSKGIEKKKRRKSPETFDQIKMLSSNIVSNRVENLSKVDLSKSALASASIKAREKEDLAFNESIMNLRKEGERLRKEFEKNKMIYKSKLISSAPKHPSEARVDKKINKAKNLESQLLNYFKNLPPLENTNEQQRGFIPVKPKNKLQTQNHIQNNTIKAKVSSSTSRLPSTSAENASISRQALRPVSSLKNLNLIPQTKIQPSIHQIPSRLVFPKYPERTVFDNTFAKAASSSQTVKFKDNENNPQQKPISENIKNYDQKDNPIPEKVYCLPIGFVKESNIKTNENVDENVSLNSLTNELDKNQTEGKSGLQVSSDEAASKPSTDYSRLPKEIKDALVRLNDPQDILPASPMLRQVNTNNIDSNMRKALINFQINQAKFTSPYGYSYTHVVDRNLQDKLPESHLKPNDMKAVAVPNVQNPTSTPKPIPKLVDSIIPNVEQKSDDKQIIKLENTKEDKQVNSKPFLDKVKKLFLKYKCCLSSTMRSWDMSKKIKSERQKKSILLYRGGKVLNQLNYKSKKLNSFKNIKKAPQVENISKTSKPKPKIIRSSKYKRNLYRKSNNYYFKIKTKPAKKKSEKALNLENINGLMEPGLNVQMKSPIPLPPAMAYSEVLSAVYSSKRTTKFV